MPITPAVFGLVSRFLYHLNPKRLENCKHDHRLPTSKKGYRSLLLNFNFNFKKYISSNQADNFVGDRSSIGLVVCKVWFWDGHGIVFYNCVH